MRPIWYVVLGVVVSFLLICLWRHHIERRSAVPPIEEVVVVVDTLEYFDIEPIAITAPREGDSTMIYHFADTVDGRWSADVAGRDVELRSLVLHQSYETRRSTNFAPPSWEVAMQGGFSGATSWVGLGVERNVGRLKLSLGAGYDPLNRTPHLQGSVGLVLWREY